MTKTPCIFVFHNHQPVGNFPWVTEECYQTAYEPFLTVLERHPRVRVGLHFTGPLLAWLRAERPEYLARVRALVDAGQVEILGGGIFEPILPVIPERDRRGQLILLSQWVEETFGHTPSGAWLAERVWEPSLPPSLQAAGIDYVLLDDEVFHRQGFTPLQTCRTFITEEDGATVRVLPISRRLRYTIPEKPVADVLRILRAMAAEGAEVIIYAEDGERFGNWPGTQAYLYGKEHYLEQLMTAIETADELECVLPGDYVRAHAPRERVYLPPTSYQEMLEWSGGFWRNFLTRYRESNLMHKKMCQVSRWVAQAEDDGHDVTAARHDLYAAQCNCAYWYGAFGGLYLPHLRRAVYQHLLRAEAAVAPVLPPETRPPLQVTDHDADGRAELFLRAESLSVGIAPAQGGGIFALEHLELAHNFLNTMARYPLHKDTIPDGVILPVDWHPRFSCLDHLLSPATTVEDMPRNSFGELGDFVLGAYECIHAEDDMVTLRRDGHFWDGPAFVPLRIDKRFRIEDGRLCVEYTLTNTTDQTRSLRFAVEMQVQLTAGDVSGRQLTVPKGRRSKRVRLEAVTALPAIAEATFRDEWLGGALTCRVTPATAMWIYPIQTPLCALDGLEWVYQSTVSLPVWQLTLGSGESWSAHITLDVAKITPAPASAVPLAGITR
jgi:alpha-amylase